MKKTIITIIILNIIFAIGVIFYITKDDRVVYRNVKEVSSSLAIMVYDEATSDYIEQNIVPKGEFVINESKTHCLSNGEITSYDKTNGTITYALTSGDSCYVYFDVYKGPTVAAGENLAQAIVAFGQNNEMAPNGSWGIINENGYRYEGSDYVLPSGGNATDIVSCTGYASCTFTGDNNSATYTSYREAAEAAVAQGKLNYSGIQNYVCFEEGCEDKDKYRIIGTFNVTYDTNKDGSATDTGNLTKIIKDELIKKEDGSVLQMAFEADNVGYYIGSDMETYINNTYGASLSSKVQGLSVPVTYHLGNVTWNKTAPEQYAEERGSTVHTDRLASTVTTYGLIYPSDYGYAVLAGDCARTTNTAHTNSQVGTGYYVSACSQENWMYNYGLNGQKNWWWNISPDASNAAHVFSVTVNGYVSHPSASNAGGAVRPSWYLDPLVKVLSGNGTKDNPYILGL